MEGSTGQGSSSWARGARRPRGQPASPLEVAPGLGLLNIEAAEVVGVVMRSPRARHRSPGSLRGEPHDREDIRALLRETTSPSPWRVDVARTFSPQVSSLVDHRS